MAPPHHHASSSSSAALLPIDVSLHALGHSVAHSVAFWPPGAHDVRHVLRISKDVDFCRFPLSAFRNTTVSRPCVHSARTGARVQNLVVHDGSTLVFEPEEGPGEYELYFGCEDTHTHELLGRPEAWWLSRWRMDVSRDVRRMPSALLIRRQPRAAVIGPPWRDEFEPAPYGNKRYSAGNVRARIVVSEDEARSGVEAVRALVPWRRRRWPSQTQLLLYYGPRQLGPIDNLEMLSESRDAALILFDPRRYGAGEYSLYYLPHTTRWEAYDARDDPHGTAYDPYTSTVDPTWLRRNLGRGMQPHARVLDVQARTHRDRFDAMERPATKVELARHLRAAATERHNDKGNENENGNDGDGDGDDYEKAAAPPAVPAELAPLPWLLFPESRQWPLKTSCELPERWANARPSRSLATLARLNESLNWQVGVFAASAADVRVLGASLVSAAWVVPPSPGHVRPSGRADEREVAFEGELESLQFRAYNLHGTGHSGEPVEMRPLVRAGCARSLWLGMQVPASIPPHVKHRLDGDTVGDTLGATASSRADDEDDEAVLELRVRLTLEAIYADDAVAAAAAALMRSANASGGGGDGGGGGGGGGGGPRDVHTHLRLTLSGPPLGDNGDARRWRLSRLRWLDSTLGTSPQVPAPFEPVSATALGPMESKSWLERLPLVGAGLVRVESSVSNALSQAVSAATGLPVSRASNAPAAPTLALTAKMGRLYIGSDGLPAQVYAGAKNSNNGSSGGHALLDEPMRFDVSVRVGGSVRVAGKARRFGGRTVPLRSGARGGASPISSEAATTVEDRNMDEVEDSLEVAGAQKRCPECVHEEEPVEWRLTKPAALRTTARRPPTSASASASAPHGRSNPGACTTPVCRAEAARRAHRAAPEPSPSEVARWSSEFASVGGDLTMRIDGEWWFDAQALVSVTLAAPRSNVAPVQIAEAKLTANLQLSAATYLMGLGKAGQLLRLVTPLEYHWEAGAGNHMVWMGDAHAGMRLKLVGDAPGYESPQFIPTQSELPSSWHNGGLGGVNVTKGARFVAYSGARLLRPGEAVTFKFELLLTPVKPLDLAAHSRARYYQVGYPTPELVQPSEVAATGATVLNIHQGVNGFLNPHINYPFERETHEHLSEYVSDAHSKGLKVKAYYTVRELSTHADELWVLRSLGDEVLKEGPAGGGDAWSHEHLVEDYAACWQTPLADGTFDAALCNTGISRWVNYYVEGLARFLGPSDAGGEGGGGLGLGLDGIYYDGIAFGVHTMRRIRRVLETSRGRGHGLIDLHCGNNLLGPSYGRVSPALQFMHLMPYIDSLWFGEGFDYQRGGPAYWLVEASGIPFGLMGDMMGGGHTWRGLVHGMTTRFRCADPSPLWRLYDSFGMAEAHMVGYWEPSTPIGIDGCPAVLGTSYVIHGRRTLVVLASWESGGALDLRDAPTCRVEVDWAALGLPVTVGGKLRVRARALDPFKEAGGEAPLRVLKDGSAPLDVRLNPGGGALLLLESAARK